MAVFASPESPSLLELLANGGGLAIRGSGSETDPPFVGESSRTVVFHWRLSEAAASLNEAYKECSSDNWDGYGAAAVSEMSYLLARRFLEMLPTSVPLPEVSVDPDGEVSLEWCLQPKQVFSVSVGPNRELSYAGLFGGNKAYGSEYFGDEIPRTILQQLGRLFSQATRSCG